MTDKTNTFPEVLRGGMRRAKEMFAPNGLRMGSATPAQFKLDRQNEMAELQAMKEATHRQFQNNAFLGSISGAMNPVRGGANQAVGLPYGAGAGGLGQAFKPTPPPDPNTIPAYTMSVRDLLTLFEAKCNGRWVKRDDLRDDPFWVLGYGRLGQYGLIESSFDGYWVRVKETV